jgi:hypothetical protein
MWPKKFIPTSPNNKLENTEEQFSENKYPRGKYNKQVLPIPINLLHNQYTFLIQIVEILELYWIREKARNSHFIITTKVK